MGKFRSLEICAGVGGQALGLEEAGFEPVMLIDNDPAACETLRRNRPHWDVRQADVVDFVGADHPQVLDVDLLSAGIPTTPYSVASSQQGVHDKRDLLRAAIWLTTEVRPRCLLVMNVARLLQDDRHAETREWVGEELKNAGYDIAWSILNAMHFGVPQDRPYSILVAMRPQDLQHFEWPAPHGGPVRTVGDVLFDSMASEGWRDAEEWRRHADKVAPAIVGGSKDRGGGDLGPSGSKARWARLGVNGSSLANDVPAPDFELRMSDDPKDNKGLPKLTVAQVARLQALPETWYVWGLKTASYRQIAHAVPPPLVKAVGLQIAKALEWPER